MLSSIPYFKTPDSRIVLYNNDCGDILPQIEDGSIKAIITDPPFGISWKSNWTEKHAQKDILANDRDLSWMVDFLLECERLLAEDGSLYIMTRWDKLGFLTGLVKNVTKLFVRNCIVWDRMIHGLGDLKSFAPVYDMILYVTKTKNTKLVSEYRYSNLWSINRENDRFVGHPTSKPVALFDRMLTCSTAPGDLVLDPFSGSGASLVSANKLGRHAIGVELDTGFCNITVGRLRQTPLFMEQSEMVLGAEEKK